jgi:hypothetical protein
VPDRVTVRVNALSIALGNPVQKGLVALCTNRKVDDVLDAPASPLTDMSADDAVLVATRVLVEDK